MASRANLLFLILVQKKRTDDYYLTMELVGACARDLEIVLPKEKLFCNSFDQKDDGSPGGSGCTRVKIFSFTIMRFLYVSCADMASFVNELKIMKRF